MLNSPERVFDFVKGELLLIDKPVSWTSFDVVNKIRHLISRHLNVGKIKVGHAGTLDPLATGLLIICTGKMTKKIGDLQGLDKQYAGKIFLGATTPSYDLETEIDQEFPIEHISEKMIRENTASFMGNIMQVPPAFSAIKVDGTRAYKLARDNIKVEIQAREVNIASFEIDTIDLPEIGFTVDCSKGTYIRTLAHDFGKSLDSGAYLKELRRTKVGEFDIQNALNMEQIEYLILSLSQQNS